MPSWSSTGRASKFRCPARKGRKASGQPTGQSMPVMSRLPNSSTISSSATSRARCTRRHRRRPVDDRGCRLLRGGGEVDAQRPPRCSSGAVMEPSPGMAPGSPPRPSPRAKRAHRRAPPAQGIDLIPGCARRAARQPPRSAGFRTAGADQRCGRRRRSSRGRPGQHVAVRLAARPGVAAGKLPGRPAVDRFGHGPVDGPDHGGCPGPGTLPAG